MAWEGVLPVSSGATVRVGAGPKPQRLVQRCACGGKSSGECESCKKKKEVQRKRATSRGGDRAFRAAPQLARGGAPLPAHLQESLAPLYGTDFRDVRIHDDSGSHAAAREVSARAFTFGQHIHFGSGEFRPDHRDGRSLIAHELVHTIQQRGAEGDPGAPVRIDDPDSIQEREADRVAERVVRNEAPAVNGPTASCGTRAPGAAPLRRLVQRVGIGQFFARLFGEGTFSDKELLDYLQYLDDHATIEGDYDSDNKARAIIRRWRARDRLFHPTLTQKRLMLLELIDGPTLDDDEHAILELLRGSTESEVLALIGTAGGEEALQDEFHGSESDELDAFLETWHAKRGHRSISTEEVEKKKVAITEVVVNQDTPQVVTVRYTDGRVEANTCSTGKGTCCIEPGTHGGPSAAATQLEDSNWTPIGTHVVQFTKADHDGIRWWTQFNSRAIALHEYSPVDGTPLSHGCVRLHGDFARRIFEGARPGHTIVRVVGVPRPRCDHGALKTEWEHDFSAGSGTPQDGEARALRAHLRVAFGHPSDKVLEQKISEGNIPRCLGGQRAPGKP
jgi:hypothetical protein